MDKHSGDEVVQRTIGLTGQYTYGHTNLSIEVGVKVF